MTRARLVIAIVVAALTLSACSGITAKISRRFGGKVLLDVELDPRLNQDFPLAVDFGIVYDKDLLAELQKLSASEWFEQREQYMIDHQPERLVVRSWEWVPRCTTCRDPGQQVVEHRLGARGGIVFANYFNPGVHRVVVEPLRAFSLKLGETEAQVGPPPSRKQTRAERKEEKAAQKRAKKAEKKEKKKAKNEASGS